MCIMWGYAQGWWTVAGLVCDILGFTLLAIDLGREYMRHRTAVTLEEGATSAEWLMRERDESMDMDTERGRLQREWRDLMRRTQQGLMRAAEITADPSGKVAAVDNLEGKVEAFRALAREVRESPFKRAPIFTGIFFVIVGFMLQVVGAIPCT